MTKTGVACDRFRREPDSTSMKRPKFFEHPHRPTGVTLIAAIQGLNALTIGLLSLVALATPDVTVHVSDPVGIGAGAFSILGIVIALGLWFLQRWAWVVTMLWAGLVLLTSLWAYFNDQAVSYFSMALSLVQVLYLNMTEVQEAFERKPERRRGREAHYG
jgi:hypothetical protein